MCFIEVSKQLQVLMPLVHESDVGQIFAGSEQIFPENLARSRIRSEELAYIKAYT